MHQHLLSEGRYHRLDALAGRRHVMSEFQRARLEVEDVAGAPSKAEPHPSEQPREAAT